MTSPPYLKKGDKVAIVATARKISAEELQPAISTIESWGLEVVTGKNVYAQCHQFAGTDTQRLEDFQTALDDDSVKAIICARGGYGTVRIVDQIDFSGFAQKPKWIVGYSDVTALHSHIHQNFSMQTLHAIMPINFPKDGQSCPATDTLRKALFGETLNYQFSRHPLNRPGSCEGLLTGGNLSMLYSLRGTPSDIETRGKVLFLEDLDEYLYHVDRMMMNLKRGGMLKNLAGLVVGGMTDMNDNAVGFGKTAEQITREHVEEYEYPVCFGFPAGHLEGENNALKLGKRIRLEVGERVVLGID